MLVLGFGSFFGRHTRSTKDFFFGGQRFSWWIISFSLVATTVGSYSFIKYSRVAFTHGLSSTMSYTNDWFWMPMLIFVWLPIDLLLPGHVGAGVLRAPLRNKRVRLVTTIVIMVYLLGYIGDQPADHGRGAQADARLGCQLRCGDRRGDLRASTSPPAARPR